MYLLMDGGEDKGSSSTEDLCERSWRWENGSWWFRAPLVQGARVNARYRRKIPGWLSRLWDMKTRKLAMRNGVTVDRAERQKLRQQKESWRRTVLLRSVPARNPGRRTVTFGVTAMFCPVPPGEPRVSVIIPAQVSSCDV